MELLLLKGISGMIISGTAGFLTAIVGAVMCATLFKKEIQLRTALLFFGIPTSVIIFLILIPFSHILISEERREVEEARKAYAEENFGNAQVGDFILHSDGTVGVILWETSHGLRVQYLESAGVGGGGLLPFKLHPHLVEGAILIPYGAGEEPSHEWAEVAQQYFAPVISRRER